MPQKCLGPSAGGDAPDAAARQLWYGIGTTITRVLAVDVLQKQPGRSIKSRLGCSVKLMAQPLQHGCSRVS